jgi:hypothetical protein
MPKYVIERDTPGAGSLTEDELRAAAGKSCDVLKTMAPRVQWQHSYVTTDKVFCVYIAQDEDAIREHAERAGFPVTAIARVGTVIDPATAERQEFAG